MSRKVWQLLVAPISIPGVYVYGQKYWGSFRDVYIMQQQQQNEGDIASDPAHYPFLW